MFGSKKIRECKQYNQNWIRSHLPEGGELYLSRITLLRNCECNTFNKYV